MNDEPKSLLASSDAEPKASSSTVPMWIFALTLLLIFLGTVYFDHHSGWFDANVYSPYDNAIQLDAYQPKSGAAAMMARGKQVYDQICGACHGADGLGKAGQAPPLAGSEWVNAKGDSRLAHIPLMGVNGDIKVAGQDWNMAMAAMGASLSDSDLASVLSYIRTSWGNKASLVTAEDVAGVRKAIGKNPAPMPAATMMSMPE
jgi:mono/diheme cytochrome c family protein